MDIDNIIDGVLSGRENGEKSQDQQSQEKKSLEQLLELAFFDEDTKIQIYRRFRADAIDYIDAFTDSNECKDTKKDNGMFACSHDTWSACIREFGIDYFIKNKYLHDKRRERSEGGIRFNDDLMEIALEVYENLCGNYKKVFQIYDCCNFMGISKDFMYKLNEVHSGFIKNGNTAQENSYRTGALTNRGNVTGYAMLLNHDYDYTRTTQIIHSTTANKLTADSLPTLEITQHIVDNENYFPTRNEESL